MFKWIKKILHIKRKFWLAYVTHRGVQNSWITYSIGQPLLTSMVTIIGPADTLADAMFGRERIVAEAEGRKKRPPWEWELSLLKRICEIIEEEPKELMGLTDQEIEDVKRIYKDRKLGHNPPRFIQETMRLNKLHKDNLAALRKERLEAAKAKDIEEQNALLGRKPTTKKKPTKKKTKKKAVKRKPTKKKVVKKRAFEIDCGDRILII